MGKDGLFYTFPNDKTQTQLTSLLPGRAGPEPCDGPCGSHNSSRQRCVCGGSGTAATLLSSLIQPSPLKLPGGPCLNTSAGYTALSGGDRTLCE